MCDVSTLFHLFTEIRKMIVAKLSNISDLVSSKSYYTMDEAIHLHIKQRKTIAYGLT